MKGDYKWLEHPVAKNNDSHIFSLESLLIIGIPNKEGSTVNPGFKILSGYYFISYNLGLWESY